MKKLLLSVLFLLVFSSCSSDKPRLDNARFEIEQGNFLNARKLLQAIPTDSRYRAEADSILKSIENR